uniref:NHS like 1 n=1 Tax=Sphenodon punctatus TaxID=8508 RepID=A0A8D0H9G3_SPHPU
MKKECASRSFRLKHNTGSLSRAVSWINFSSLSRQTKRLFRSDGELSSTCGQQDEENKDWIYRTQHRKAVSNLDEESRWTVHYTAPWHQQENVFLPSTRPPCVEDLHRQAKLNLKSVLRECDKLRRDGYRSSQYYSQGPTFSSSSAFCESSQDDYEEIEQKSSVPSPEEETLINIKRAKTPLTNEFSDINTQTNWTKSLPLPTPEEKMRQQAQAVQTDVVPINVTAVGSGQSDFRGHSMYVPDHYSTLGRLESYRSAVLRSETKDSSCQTEEVKVVPPSMRRIRAQKGQGIAAQMSHLSRSSGNMSVMSDSAGVIFASRLKSDMGFHSLPRSGARVSLQSLPHRHNISKQIEDGSGTLPHQISKLQVDDSVVHMRNSPRTGTLPRPKSQEVRSYESEKPTSLACVVSPHATYATSIIPNATLSSSSEVIVIHTTQSAGQLDSKITNSSPYTKPRDNPVASSVISRKDHHSSSGNWSESSSTHHSQTSDAILSNTMMISLGDSAVSLNASGNAENGSQGMTYSCRNNLSFPSQSQDSDSRSESSYLGDRAQSKSENSTERWIYKSSGNEMPLHKPTCTTPGYSTPVSNMSTSSLERASAKEDSSSLYSVDHDGYYTSMHMDSGLKSGKTCNSNNNGYGNPRHSVINVFDGTEKKSQTDLSNYSEKSLPRNISLKKAKKPLLPPSRTDSLRRIPKKKVQSNGQVLDEKLIASLQHSLQLNLKCKNSSSPSQSPCSDYEDPWVLRSRSQSSVSASSSMLSTTAPNLYSICAVTPSQSETSSIKSEYADQWGYYSDYTVVADDQLKPPAVHSTGTTVTLSDYTVTQLSEGTSGSIPQVPSGLVKPKNTSPEKSHRVTSPSSGYSSQSNTPTALTPVPVVLKSVSTGNGKPKLRPKVPERKSSLLSSVSMSSSSTSLSSNTSVEGSVNVKKMDSPMVFPSVAPLSPIPPNYSDRPPPPPPPPPADIMDLPLLLVSPNFPPPPPEAVINSPFSPSVTWFPTPSQETSFSLFSVPPPPFPSPPSPIFPSSVPPSAPPLDPILVKDATKCTQYSFKKCNQEDSCSSPVKQPLFSKQDATRPVVPLVTTKALQMVQLRSVKKAVVAETEQSVESTLDTNFQNKMTVALSSQLPLKPSLPLRHSNSLDGGEMKTCCSHVKDLLQTATQSSCLGLCDSAPQLISGRKSENAAVKSFASDLLKPPPISKKPKLFLIVPPPDLDITSEKTAKVSETVRSTSSPTRRDPRVAHCIETKDCFTHGLSSSEMDSGSLVPEGGTADATFFGTVETNVCMVQAAASSVQEAPKQEEQTTLDEGSSSDKDNTEALELDTTNNASLPNSSYGEGNEVVAIPARPRTTEDLFAAIHRSKRKVLGRKDSEDDRTQNHSPSPPVTPTSASPTLASLKQAGSIQRSIRKSSTSNDNFKALLLKKGSRSDTSSRMSAAEMLKNTDPRFQRTKADSSPDLSDALASSSPSKNKWAQEEWAKSEGPMPRSMSFSSPRYGRSRTPPSAASSKYNVRNRIQSSPMTAISEGDGEVVEPAESRVRRTLEEQQEYDECLQQVPVTCKGRFPCPQCL